MAKFASDVIKILRNVTGRVDESDPLFDDTAMLQYVNDFYQYDTGQDLRLFENDTWVEFTIDENTTDPMPLDLDDLGISVLGGLAYIGGFSANWCQDPGDFYQKWSLTTEYTRQRPSDILYYNGGLVFRSPPDQQYLVKIKAYKQLQALATTSTQLPNPYLFRYIAYGAALDVFSDFGEMDKFQATFPVFQRYRSLVTGRTNQQLVNQRSTPRY